MEIIMTEKQTLITLTPDDQTILGSAVGRLDGMAVFVKGGVAGDVCEVLITDVKKSYALAQIVRVVSPSVERIASDCPISDACGGCVHRSVNYAFEGKVKENAVRSAFSKAGVIVGEFKPIVMPESEHYRNKVTFHFDKEGFIGFFAPESKRLIRLGDVSCKVAHTAFSKIAHSVDNAVRENCIDGLSSLTLRRSSAGDICVCLTGKLDAADTDILVRTLCRTPEVTGVVIRGSEREKYKCVMGEKALTSTLAGLNFRISPEAFFQVNYGGAEALLNEALSIAEKTRANEIADLYCGTGTFGLVLASRLTWAHVTGIEINAEAVADAKYNARLNGIRNIDFFCGDAADYAKEKKPELVVVDPPRRGLSPEARELLASLGSENVIYVSCNPFTLARDCASLTESGYTVKSVTPVNMFPRSEHVECVVWLSKKE